MNILFKRLPSMACKSFIISFFLFNSLAFASPENPTKNELLATVRHIAAIAKQQQSDLDSVNKALSDAQVVEIPKLKQEISDQATELAAAQAKVTALEVSRHKYVKMMWYAMGVSALCLVWIFRKPIFAALGGIGV